MKGKLRRPAHRFTTSNRFKKLSFYREGMVWSDLIGESGHLIAHMAQRATSAVDNRIKHSGQSLNALLVGQGLVNSG